MKPCSTPSTEGEDHYRNSNSVKYIYLYEDNMLKKLFAFFSANKKRSMAVDMRLDNATTIAKLPDKNENSASSFFGEHFEGHGNAWHAVFNSEEALKVIFPKFLTNYSIPSDCLSVCEDGTQVMLFQYPETGSIMAGVLNVRAPASETLEVWSCYPILEGIPNPLEIVDTHQWSNGVEGVVAAHRENDGPPVEFFAPFFFRDHADFAKGARLDIALGALALSLEPAEQKKLYLVKGELYEMQLKKFLEEHPDKSDSDFYPPIVSMQGCRVLLPTKYVSEWEFRCPVLAVETLTFCDIFFHRLTVSFVGMDNEELMGYIYASETVLNGYRPEVGHDIEGILWMTGTIVRSQGDACS